MELFVYSIFDRVAGAYAAPFLANNDALATRQFNYTMGNAPMVAEDCQLFKLGTFNQETGVITPCVEFIAAYSGKEA